MTEENSLNENSDQFIFKLFMGANFEVLVPNLGEMSFSKEIELKRTIVGGNRLSLIGLNYLADDLIIQAKGLFIDFALEQLSPKEIRSEDLEKEIADFERESIPGMVNNWDKDIFSKIPENVFILSNNNHNTILLDDETSETILRGSELTLKMLIGFDKERTNRTNAVRILKVVE